MPDDHQPIEQPPPVNTGLGDLAGLIGDELELAHSSEGYEPKAVAEEIVKDHVAPMLAKAKAINDKRYKDRQLLLWLHAKAVWQRDVAHQMLERIETQHIVWTVAGSTEEIHPDWCRECRVDNLRTEIDRQRAELGAKDASNRYDRKLADGAIRRLRTERDAARAEARMDRAAVAQATTALHWALSCCDQQTSVCDGKAVAEVLEEVPQRAGQPDTAELQRRSEQPVTPGYTDQAARVAPSGR